MLSVLDDRLLELTCKQGPMLLHVGEIYHKIDSMAKNEPMELDRVDLEICFQQNMEHEELIKAKARYRSTTMIDKQIDQQQRRPKSLTLA